MIQKHGRWVRVETINGGGQRLGTRVINLDNVSTFYKGPQGATFRMVDGDWWDTTMPFEDACLLVMVAEADTLPPLRERSSGSPWAHAS